MNKTLLAVISVVMGLLQAWDSGVLAAGPAIQLLVAVSILIPVIAWFASSSYGVHAAAVAAAFVLLTIARIAAPVPLPTLHMIAFIPAIVIFFSRATLEASPARR